LENQIKAGKHYKEKKKVKNQIIITKNTFSSSFYRLSHERKSEERKSGKLSCLSIRKKERKGFAVGMNMVWQRSHG
jgi:hypothetical protein